MTESSIAEKIREKKKAFLAREQEIVESAKSLLIDCLLYTSDAADD